MWQVFQAIALNLNPLQQPKTPQPFTHTVYVAGCDWLELPEFDDFFHQP